MKINIKNKIYLKLCKWFKIGAIRFHKVFVVSYKTQSLGRPGPGPGPASLLEYPFLKTF